MRCFIAEGFQSFDSSARSVFTAQSVGFGVIVMAGTEKVLHLVGVQGLVHRDGEDILNRRFIEYGKVGFVIRFQTIAHFLQLVTVSDNRLPGIEAVAVYFEKEILSVGTLAVRPVVVGIDFGIQGKLRQEENNYGTGDSPVIRTGLVAVDFGQQRGGFLQFFEYKVEYRFPFALHYVFHRRG